MTQKKEILNQNELLKEGVKELNINRTFKKLKNARVHNHTTVSLNGTISAVGNFIEKRLALDTPQDDLLRCHVLFSYRNMFVKLQTRENLDTLGTKVEGKLTINPDLAKLGINQNTMMSVGELTKHLRFNKFYFADKDAHEKLVMQLQSFSATVATEIKKINDTKGNIDDVFKMTVKSNIELRFVAKMPVFIGEPDKTFPVEISCEATSGNVKFWLESSDLKELEMSEVKSIIDKELERIPAKIVRIEQ